MFPTHELWGDTFRPQDAISIQLLRIFVGNEAFMLKINVGKYSYENEITIVNSYSD